MRVVFYSVIASLFFLISWITYFSGLTLWQSGEVFGRTGQALQVGMSARDVPTLLHFRAKN